MPRRKNEPAESDAKTYRAAQAPGEAEVPAFTENRIQNDLRFSDPLVAEIVEVWRLRQDFHRAEKRLTLQIKAICRRYCEGDKVEAEKLYKALSTSTAEPGLIAFVLPLFISRDTITKSRLEREKTLRKMAKDLPIYGWCKEVRGFGELGLAATVGECGDLSAYKSVSAVWKRCGLAVIDGERQRKCADAGKALAHGYAPERRAVFWTLSDSMLKAQGKDERAGPYRRIYDDRKAYEKERGVERDIVAHNRAMRYMFKKFLRDLTVAWKAMEKSPSDSDDQSLCALSIAAE